MDPVRLSGDQLAAVLASDEVYEQIVDSRHRAVLVDGDSVSDSMDRSSIQRLETLPVVIVAVVSRPELRRPLWADMVVEPASRTLAATLSSIEANPQATTTLAMLLRSGQGRSLSEGLVAESTAYGLLQNGTEFSTWRSQHPRRQRPDAVEPTVLVSRRHHQLTITLNRPDVLNAFNAGMRDEVLGAISVATNDPSVTSVILRGAGSAFCSGGDLDEFGSRPDPVTAHLVRLQRNVARAMAEVADRTTAHIHGSTVGSGIELAAFAHRVVAAPSTRIALPEVRLGLIPGAGGTISLPRRIGRHATMLLALGLPSIGADTALRWGLVDEIGS